MDVFTERASVPVLSAGSALYCPKFPNLAITSILPDPKFCPLPLPPHTTPCPTHLLDQSLYQPGAASETPWLIVVAIWLASAIQKSGLGERLGYSLVALIGGSPLGLTYALVLG